MLNGRTETSRAHPLLPIGSVMWSNIPWGHQEILSSLNFDHAREGEQTLEEGLYHISAYLHAVRSRLARPTEVGNYVGITIRCLPFFDTRQIPAEWAAFKTDKYWHSLSRWPSTMMVIAFYNYTVVTHASFLDVGHVHVYPRLSICIPSSNSLEAA